MRKVWRICAAKYQNSAFSGIGGLYVPGRWHPQGHKIIYTAENLSLASLEVFLHLESDRLKLVVIKAELAEELAVEEMAVESLPVNWQEAQMYPKLQQVGRDWLISKRTPILKVPSAIVPIEHNYILNPEHPDFKVTLDSPINFVFDQRMWKKR